VATIVLTAGLTGVPSGTECSLAGYKCAYVNECGSVRVRCVEGECESGSVRVRHVKGECESGRVRVHEGVVGECESGSVRVKRMEGEYEWKCEGEAVG